MSEPQKAALEILDFISQREIIQQKRSAFLLAQLASGRSELQPHQVYPEVFTTEEVEDDDTQAIDESTDQYGEPISVVYDFSKAKYDEEEVERLMREMAQTDSTVNSSFADMDY